MASRRANAQRKPLNLNQQNRIVEAHAQPFAVALERALRAFGRRELNRLARGGSSALRRVAKSTDPFDDELLDIFTRYGVQHANRSGRVVAGEAWEISPGLIDRVARSAEVNVKLTARQTRNGIEDSLRDIVRQAFRETPRPTNKEILRRIARSWFGPGISARDAGWGPAQEISSEVGQHHMLSFERAASIARTQLGEIQSTATADGMEQAGVESVGWLAHRNDGRSGDRRHYLMNDHPPITVEAMRGSDQSKWFKLPDGERSPFPLWAGLSAKNKINCRCGLVPA